MQAGRSPINNRSDNAIRNDPAATLTTNEEPRTAAAVPTNMNKPKTLDNTTTQAFTADFLTARELCESCRTADDIFSGVLAAKTWGNSAARSLSRQTLFHILQSCPTITVDGIDKATAGRYATSTLQAYAAAARVASWALAGLAGRAGQKDHRPTIQEERRLIDAPFRQQLQALGLV